MMDEPRRPTENQEVARAQLHLIRRIRWSLTVSASRTLYVNATHMNLLGGVGGIGRQHKVGRSTCRLSSTDGRVGSPAALWTSRAAAAAAHSGDALFSGASQRHGWVSHVAWCSVAIDGGSRAALGLGACAPSESDTTGFPAAIDSALSSLSCAHEHATPTIAAPPKRLDALLASEVDPGLIRSHVLVAHVCASADQREGRYKSTLQYSAGRT